MRLMSLTTSSLLLAFAVLVGTGHTADAQPKTTVKAVRARQPRDDKREPHDARPDRRDGARGPQHGHRDDKHDTTQRGGHKDNHDRYQAYRRDLERRKALANRERAGKSSATEKAELQRLERTRAHYRALVKLERKRRDSWEQRRSTARERERARYQRLRSNPQAVAAYHKHAKRIARLRRVRDVAAAQGRTQLLTRIDTLVTKETARHTEWLARHGGG